MSRRPPRPPYRVGDVVTVAKHRWIDGEWRPTGERAECTIEAVVWYAYGGQWLLVPAPGHVRQWWHGRFSADQVVPTGDEYLDLLDLLAVA